MLRMSKVLIPVDFSERAGHAARYAIPFVERFESEVVLLHVLPPHLEFGSAEIGTAVLQDLIAERRARTKAQLDSYLGTEFGALPVRRVLLEGDPAHMIIQFAHQEQFDLVFMPTHGRGPFRRLLLGSVTAKVLHDVNCPVWTGVHMQEPPDHAAKLEHVVCAVDLGPGAGRILAWASRIAAEFQARLTVVHAVDTLEPLTQTYYLSPEWRKSVIDQAEADLIALQRSAGSNGSVVLGIGAATRIVPAEARQLGADLLVIGRGSRQGMLGRLTDHAYAITRESPCPTVSV